MCYLTWALLMQKAEAQGKGQHRSILKMPRLLTAMGPRKSNGWGQSQGEETDALLSAGIAKSGATRWILGWRIGINPYIYIYIKDRGGGILGESLFVCFYDIHVAVHVLNKSSLLSKDRTGYLCIYSLYIWFLTFFDCLSASLW